MDMQLSHFEDCMQNVACWAPTTEHKQVAIVRITPEDFLDQHRQAVKSLSVMRCTA